MEAYLAKRIISGKLEYQEVISVYNEFKNDIDLILKKEDRENLIK